MAEKKRPMRMCAGCMQSRPQSELLRIGCSDQGLFLDPQYKAPGRGTYVCRDQKCFDLALKKHAITRNLKVSASESSIRELQEAFGKYMDTIKPEVM